MRPRIPHLIGAILTVGCICFAATVVISPEPPEHLLYAALGLAAFAVIAELFEYRMPEGGSGSIAIIPILAIVLVAPSWQGVVVVTGCEIIHQAIKRRVLQKAVFNVGQAVLSISVAVVVYTTAGGRSFADSGAFSRTVVENAIPAVACLASVALLNTASVSAAIAISTNRGFVEVWRQNTLGTISYSALAWPFAAALAWVFTNSSPIFAAALAIPLLGVRQLYRATLKLQETNRELLEVMVKAIEARDPYTSGHSRRVAENAVVIARSLPLSAGQVERVRIAALLHDLGKIHEDFAPILRKEGPLTKDEWALMRTHSDKGADLVSTLSDLNDLVSPIRHHHENWDGTGYPAGIAGEQIPLFSRIIAFADTIDALTTDRPYRPARTHDQVRAELVRCRGTQFDPSITDVVLSSKVWSQLFPESQSREKRVSTPRGVRLVKLG